MRTPTLRAVKARKAVLPRLRGGLGRRPAYALSYARRGCPFSARTDMCYLV